MNQRSSARSAANFWLIAETRARIAVRNICGFAYFVRKLVPYFQRRFFTLLQMAPVRLAARSQQPAAASLAEC
jgi:hypothetical protein